MFSNIKCASEDHAQLASWKPFMSTNESFFLQYAPSRGVLCSTLMTGEMGRYQFYLQEKKERYE